MGHPEKAATPRTSICRGHQPELVEAILQAGRPTVLVAVSGRPYALGQYQRRVAAMVQAFFPGEGVARHSPECYLAGSIPPANCSTRCPATLAASHTPTWRRLSD
jgi:hypothetical protein